MTDTYEVRRTVLRNRPSILFLNIHYTGKGLRSREVLGQKVILTIQPDDIRTLKARLPSGKSLGTLEMLGWECDHPLILDKLRQKLHEHKRRASVDSYEERVYAATKRSP
jgi:hypothetical protein